MFDLNVYNKIKQDYDQAFQYFNNVSAIESTQSEIDCAIFNLNAAVQALGVFYNQKVKIEEEE